MPAIRKHIRQRARSDKTAHSAGSRAVSNLIPIVHSLARAAAREALATRSTPRSSERDLQPREPGQAHEER